MILQPLASAIAVLTDDEKDLGVCLIDIGGGTTDIAVFAGGAIRHTAVIPIAGDQVTNDIAMTLRTPTKEAEELKIRYGCALRQLADPNDIIEVPGVGERGAAQAVAADARRGDRAAHRGALFAGAGGAARARGFEELLSSGIVLTGGSALLQGMAELGEEVFHMPVRVGDAGVHRAGSPTSCAARATRPRSGCCSRAATSTCARRVARAQTTGHRRRRGADEAMVQGEFLDGSATIGQRRRDQGEIECNGQHLQHRQEKGAHHV